MMKKALTQYVDPELLKSKQFGNSKAPCVQFEIAQDTEHTFWARCSCRHDPFGCSVNKTERKYYSTAYMSFDEIVSQLFNTLTFDGSPYYWYKTYFRKRMQCA